MGGHVRTWLNAHPGGLWFLSTRFSRGALGWTLHFSVYKNPVEVHETHHGLDRLLDPTRNQLERARPPGIMLVAVDVRFGVVSARPMSLPHSAALVSREVAGAQPAQHSLMNLLNETTATDGGAASMPIDIP